LCLGIFLAGCSSPRADNQRYIPSETRAQEVLDTALTAWHTKGEPGQVQEADPAIHLVDTHHQPGQKLAGFKILGAAAGDADRCYAVRLTFEQPQEDVRARYVVFGQDPMWVVRYEDYEMIIHWDHPPEHHGSGKVTWRTDRDPQ
jgi:hypothetical protein